MAIGTRGLVVQLRRVIRGAIPVGLALMVAFSPSARVSSAPEPHRRTYVPLAQGLEQSARWGVVSCCNFDVLLDPTAAEHLRWSGAGWTRFGVEWRVLEPNNTMPAWFDWSLHDRMFGQATRLNLKVVAILGNAPGWASDTPRGEGPLRPGRLDDWIEYVEAVVGRYSKPPYNQHYWNVYNEPDGRPDVDHYVGMWGYDPAGYAELLKATYAAIHRVDPQAQVVITLAYDWFTDEGGLFVRDWLDAVIDPARGNAGAAFDVFGLHMYTYYRDRWEPHGRDIAGKTNYLRALMARYGVVKPMIVTEMGEGAGLFGEPEVQARYVIKGTVRALDAGHEAVLWYSLTDSDDWKRGLLTADLAPRPALAAARRLVSELPRPVPRGDARARLALDADVEGYYFATPLGETLVLWLDREEADARRSVSVPARTVRVSDRRGDVRHLSDGDDGLADGRVALGVTREPLFVRVTGAAAQTSRG